MTAAQKILASALALPEDERATLVDALEDSLSRKAALGPGWTDEIARRIARVERGESRLVPGDEVMARVRKSLRDPRL